MLIVAERINATRKRIREALENKDAALIAEEAKNQLEAGADYIDVNAGAHPDREVDDMTWMLDVVQDAVDAPIALDSSSSEVILKNIDKVKQTPMINSVTLETKKFDEMKAVIEAREADIVALCMDDSGLPKNSDEAFDNAERLLAALEKLGVKRERIFFDPLIQAVSAEQDKGLIALETIRRIHANLEGVNTVCGLSNISFGLPERFLVNRTFMTLAIGAGLTAAIVDPLDGKLMTSVIVTEMLLGKDNYCKNYMTAFRKKRIVP